MRTLPRTRGCFGCGTENAAGLGIAPRVDDDGVVRAECRPGPALRGWRGVVHGGIVCAMLDEVMGFAAGATYDALVATAALDVVYRRPVPVETESRLEARATRRRGRFYHVTGRVLDAEGRLLAEGRGKYLALDPKMRERFTGSARSMTDAIRSIHRRGTFGKRID